MDEQKGDEDIDGSSLTWIVPKITIEAPQIKDTVALSLKPSQNDPRYF
jgi:hypothetical protein